MPPKIELLSVSDGIMDTQLSDLYIRVKFENCGTVPTNRDVRPFTETKLTYKKQLCNNFELQRHCKPPWAHLHLFQGGLHAGMKIAKVKLTLACRKHGELPDNWGRCDVAGQSSFVSSGVDFGKVYPKIPKSPVLTRAIFMPAIHKAATDRLSIKLLYSMARFASVITLKNWKLLLSICMLVFEMCPGTASVRPFFIFCTM